MEKSDFFIVILWFCVFLNDVESSGFAKETELYVNDDHRIVGGYDVTIKEFPYMAHLILKRGKKLYQCGGSIISKHYILTAAHCLTNTTKVYARVGSTYSNTGGMEYDSRTFKSHPRYKRETFDYDIGYVRFSEIHIDRVNTAIVMLAESNSTLAPATSLTVIGWGDTMEDGKESKNLKAVQVPVVSRSKCRRSYKKITSRMICAGVPQGGKGSCQGDSGGPAVTDHSVQEGIVSYGIGCARPRYPGVYTSVARLRKWIRKNTGV